MELTSIDYARLIQYASQKMHMALLNKTQINKILFYVYGVYLAETGKLLFSDDTPKAWPYGPVFPRVNKNIDTSAIIKKFPDDVTAEYNKNPKALFIIKKAVDAMYNKSAYSLTQWSHKEGSPWYRTLYENIKEGEEQAKWNTPIRQNFIEEYFSNPKNLIQ